MKWNIDVVEASHSSRKEAEIVQPAASMCFHLNWIRIQNLLFFQTQASVNLFFSLHSFFNKSQVFLRCKHVLFKFELTHTLPGEFYLIRLWCEFVHLKSGWKGSKIKCQAKFRFPKKLNFVKLKVCSKIDFKTENWTFFKIFNFYLNKFKVFSKIDLRTKKLNILSKMETFRIELSNLVQKLNFIATLNLEQKLHFHSIELNTFKFIIWNENMKIELLKC